MPEFYIKNEAGEFVEASKEVDEEFHRRSHQIVSNRINEIREKALEEARPEIEERVRKETVEKIREEVKTAFKGEYDGKLAEAENRVKELDAALRRKTIAAEYGFKPEAEQFLGDGTDDDMRAKADTLKSSFAPQDVAMPDKGSADPVSKVQQETGLNIVV